MAWTLTNYWLLNEELLVQTQFDKHSRLKRRKSAIINTLNSQTNGDEHDPGTFESARETVTNYPNSTTTILTRVRAPM